MKSIKKIGVLAILIAMLMPVGNVFADTINYPGNTNYQSGYFDTDSDNIESHDFPSAFIDNNLQTSMTAGFAQDVYTINLKEAITVTGFYFSQYGSTETFDFVVRLIDSNQQTLANVKSAEDIANFFPISDVEQIQLVFSQNNTFYEFDFFAEGQNIPDTDGDGIPDSEDEYPNDPTNTNLIGILDNPSLISSSELKTSMYDNDITTKDTIRYNSTLNVYLTADINVNAFYINPETFQAITVKYLNDGVVVYQSPEYTPEGLNNTEIYTIDQIQLVNSTNNSRNIYEFEVFETDQETPPEEDTDGDGIPDSEDEYPDDPTNTPPDDNGNGIPDSEEPMEVRDLQMEISDKRVDLSWKLPPANFDKATIYRKQLGTTETASIFSFFAPKVVSAAEDFTPLFETNGTTFSDLTIQPETEYQYKVTSTYNGIESDGVVTTASIPAPPMLDLSGAELPFNAGELISTGGGLLAFIAGFVLLPLTFVLVAKVIKIIYVSFGGGKYYYGDTAKERATNYIKHGKADRRAERQERRAEKRERREARQSSYVPREPRQSRRG